MVLSEYERHVRNARKYAHALYNAASGCIRDLNHERLMGVCRRWDAPWHLREWLRDMPYGLRDLIEAPVTLSERNQLIRWFFSHHNMPVMIQVRFAGIENFFREIGPIHRDLYDASYRTALFTLVEPPRRFPDWLEQKHQLEAERSRS